MRLADARALPALATAVYAGYQVIVGTAPWGAVAVAVAAGSMVALVPSRWVRGGWWPFALGAAIVALTSLWASVAASPTPALMQSGLGLVFGAPFLAAAWAVRWRSSLAASLVNLPVAFLAGAFSLAVSRSVVHPASLGSWWASLTGTIQAQASAISGSGSALPPLGYVGDLTFDALVLLGLGVLLLSMLHLPARMVALDAVRLAPSAADGPFRRPPPPAEASEIPPSAYLAGGIVSLVVALGTLLAFLWATMVSLPAALLALAVGVTLAILGSGWLVVRTPGPRPTRRAAATRRQAPAAVAGAPAEAKS